MTHCIRKVWAIPETLPSDVSLLLTFAVTLNFDAEMTVPPHLVRSQCQAATPEQLQAAAEAAPEAYLPTGVAAVWDLAAQAATCSRLSASLLANSSPL